MVNGPGRSDHAEDGPPTPGNRFRREFPGCQGFRRALSAPRAPIDRCRSTPIVAIDA
jgi:hypothetical protein